MPHLSSPSHPPSLSTPDTRLFHGPFPIRSVPGGYRRSPESIRAVYEIERTADEIGHGGWERVALQFPDDLLTDAPSIFEELSRRLSNVDRPSRRVAPSIGDGNDRRQVQHKLFILGDTSYGSCCVDEVAAEHVDAGVVVHYGRACLSPTARLPVIHVFTHQTLALGPLIQTFKETFPNVDEKIVLMADVSFVNHMEDVHAALKTEGYMNVLSTSIVHDPGAVLPNRRIVRNSVGHLSNDASNKFLSSPKLSADLAQDTPEVESSLTGNTAGLSISQTDDTLDTDGSHELKLCHLFHIADPPASLLLTLASRVASFHTYSVKGTSTESTLASAGQALRRRYALITSVSTVSIFGILINTLSVKNYLHVVEHVRKMIAAAGRKSYTFVVGKLNAAKVANFAEVGGWVVIGCWESSLIDSKDFYKPILTPFELELALRRDSERVWTGEWTSDFNEVLQKGGLSLESTEEGADAARDADFDSDPESAAPDFDLRTGRYVADSRVMNTLARGSGTRPTSHHNSLVKKEGDVAVIGGHVSPAVEFLRSKRTWQGLGSDFSVPDEGPQSTQGALVEEGVTGTAKAYRYDRDRTK
ncbi:MAG: Diphthamide biosynthesis protein 2 [Piccolia ochrophora]|nr:MAG: Diphthamide biosynthesis protein 2 [Piccolia ochrophora]